MSEVNEYLQALLNLLIGRNIHGSVAEFVFDHKGWSPDRAAFDYTDLLGNKNTGEVLEFLPISRADHDDIIHLNTRLQHEGRICSRFLVVARESGGHLILIEIGTGAVYLWDHDHEDIYPQNTHLLAASLQEFVNNTLYALE